MKVWTYLEAKTKLNLDYDLEDETFITPNELAGYFNDALSEAESEIVTINEDYLKSKYYLPLITGTSVYALPYNIYANKIRKIMYSNGSLIYEIVRYRGSSKFSDMANTDQFGVNDDYRYDLINDSPGQAQVELHPTARETATITAVSPFVPAIMSYIRNCARIPIVGEYCCPQVVYAAAVNTGSGVITVGDPLATPGIPSRGVSGAFPGSIALVTGDWIKVTPGTGGTLPSPLVVGTPYYVTAITPTAIILGTSASIAVTLTTQGVGYFTIQVAATTAIQNAVLIDIPEFMGFLMAWVKAAVLFKEKDPGYQDAATFLVQQKKQMVDTLTNSVPDDDDRIIGDYSFYKEFS